MEPNEREEMTEKTLANGDILTVAKSISKSKGGFEVDCWDKEGNNRWNRWFKNEIDAQAEYDRWN